MTPLTKRTHSTVRERILAYWPSLLTFNEKFIHLRIAKKTWESSSQFTASALNKLFSSSCSYSSSSSSPSGQTLGAGLSLFFCPNVFLYVYVYICIYIYIYICMYVCIHTYIHTRICICIYIHIYHIYSYTYRGGCRLPWTAQRSAAVVTNPPWLV